MLLLIVINTCLHYTYAIDVKQEGEGDVKEKIQGLLRSGKKPKGSAKYQQKCQTEWLNVWNAYDACTHLTSSKRPDPLEALNILREDVQGCADLYLNAKKG